MFFNPHIVLKNIKRFELRQQPKRLEMPELVTELEWSSCDTPRLRLPDIQIYSAYIDSRLSSAIDGSIPLTPTIARLVAKRNKGQTIIALNGALALEELEKRRVTEARKTRHKRDAGQRRILLNIG